MKELEILLEKRWILKSEDKELYYKIRDSIGEIRKFATEKLGCQVLENSLMVKMEKIPAIPESFMGIEEFTKELAEMVQAKLNGVEVTPMKNLKNNGVVVHGLTFRREDENVAPTLYLEGWFEKFKSKRLSINGILEQIIRTYQELDEPNIPDMDEYLSSPGLISKVNVRLLNLKKNRRMIEERNLVFHKVPNTDMVCLFYITVSNDGYTIGEIALSETLMERYLPTFKDAKELYDEVISKVSADTISLEPVAKFANKIIKDRGFDLPPIPLDANFLHVLTNDRRMFGASVLLTEAGRRMTCD